VTRIRESVSLNDVVLTLGGASFGDGWVSFGPGARAWIFSQIDHQNIFNSRGGI